MLFPIIVQLANEEVIVWQENKTLLEQLGFIGELRNNELNISAAPTILKEKEISNCINEAIHLLKVKKIDKSDIAHQVVSVIARSSSYNAVVQIQEQAVELVNALFQLPEHTYTVSGKPILKTITLEEIGLKFK